MASRVLREGDLSMILTFFLGSTRSSDQQGIPSFEVSSSTSCVNNKSGAEMVTHGPHDPPPTPPGDIHSADLPLLGVYQFYAIRPFPKWQREIDQLHLPTRRVPNELYVDWQENPCPQYPRPQHPADCQHSPRTLQTH